MRKHRLRIYVLTCMIGICVIILSFLWIFLVSFFSTYYQYNKTKTAESISDLAYAYYTQGDYEESLDTLAYNEAVCIDIYKNGKAIYTSNSSSRGCLPKSNGDASKHRFEFEQSNKDNEVYSVVNPLFNNRTLIYAKRINSSTYLYVNTSIDPSTSSIKILKSVLIYITILMILISIILSLYLSKRISYPILKLNKKARHLASSEFKVIDNDLNSNITELEELNDSIIHAKNELSKLDETRRDLLANVSHDLKTPLTMIKAYAELSRDINLDDKEKIKENMGIIIEESDRLNGLVNEILELSKLQKNMDVLEKETFDITELINNVIKRFNIYEDTEKYNFVFEYNKPLYIEADKSKIEQVIYNLITNAMNYTGEDKKITILITEKNGNYRISIIDTGKGIDKEEIDKIWDKYYKNEKHHKRDKVGTGLGLSIVKEILLSHKFRYGVKSKKGEGSTFYFDIPKRNVKKNV